MALTSAMEDYLEAILMIKQQHGCGRAIRRKKAFGEPSSEGIIQIRPSC